MESRDIIVLTSPGDTDPSLAIAACRAGARGVLDLEFCADPIAAGAALARVAHFAGSRFGVQLRTDASFPFSVVLAASVKPERAIITGGNRTELATRVRELRTASIEVLLEATDLCEATRGVELGVAGLILKGHEAGGRVGTDTSFIHLQKWRQYSDRSGVKLPFWMRGGIGPNTAAACLAGGACGVVLDSHVLLARESQLREAARKQLAGLDGSETAVLGVRLGELYRIYCRPDSPAAQQLAREEERLEATDLPQGAKLVAWREAVRERIVARPRGRGLANWARCFPRRGASREGRHRWRDRPSDVRAQRKANRFRTPLAAPVGRFAARQVARHQIPDLARADDAGERHGRVRRCGRRWRRRAFPRPRATSQDRNRTTPEGDEGETREAAVGRRHPRVRAARDSLASSSKRSAFTSRRSRSSPAGGPDQAKELEAQGIPTYLHVPSPGLLRMFLKDGARRFIFEGQECGGHVGPRSSFASVGDDESRCIAEHLGSQPGRRSARRLRGRHPRRPVGGNGRGAERRVGRKGRQGRRAARHRVPVHERGSRSRRDHRPIPEGSLGMPARQCCWKPAPATRSAASRRLTPTRSRLRSGSCETRGSRRSKSGSRWSG